MQMRDSYIKSKCSTKRTTQHIYRCLAPCSECTGQYVSEVLSKRLICCCDCHNRMEVDEGTEPEYSTARVHKLQTLGGSI
jgi:hypothetical protein